MARLVAATCVRNASATSVEIPMIASARARSRHHPALFLRLSAALLTFPLWGLMPRLFVLLHQLLHFGQKYSLAVAIHFLLQPLQGQSNHIAVM